MADTNTTITDLLKMETGTHDNDWGINLDLVLDNIDTMTKATRTTATTGGTTTFTKTTAREPFQRVTGVLIANAIIEIPAAAAAWWWFKNETTGAFTLTVKVTGQTGVVIEQGNSKLVRGNGTDIVATGMPSLADIQTSVVGHSTAVAGTVDAIQVTLSPVSTSLTQNEVLRWKSAGTNTIVAPTMSKDGGVTNKIIKKGASVALAVGDLGTSGYECVALYNNVDWILQNPAGLAHVASANTFTGANTFNGPISSQEVSLAVAVGVATWDMTTGPDYTLAIAANVTINNAINMPTSGGRGTLRINNSSAAPVNLVWGANYVVLNGTLPAKAEIGNAVYRYWTQGSLVYIVSKDNLLTSSTSAMNFIRKATADARNTAVLANDTDFTFSMLANTDYAITVRYYVTTTAATTGLQIGLSGPAAPTSSLITMNALTGSAFSYSASVLASTSSSGILSLTQSAPASAEVAIVDVRIIWRNVTAGTFTLQTANKGGGANGTATFNVNSELTWRTF